MVEKNLVVNSKEIEYSGIFSVNDLFSTLNQCIEERGYRKKEKRHEETVTQDGKNLLLELRPTKVRKENMTFWIKIKIGMQNITDVTQEIDSKEQVFQKGDLKLIFDAWVYTDNKKHWSQRPFTAMVEVIIHKIFKPLPIDSSYYAEVIGDTAYIYGKVKELLSSYRKKDTHFAFEKEVMKSVDKEIAKGVNE